MQYNFQEGLLCGLLMTHDSGSYNSNKNYKPLNDPLFNYILENYIPKVEIIMTPHYTYKYYFDVTPFYSNDDILLWKKCAHSGYKMRVAEGTGALALGPDDYTQGTRLHAFQKAINSQEFAVFEMKAWYRDDKPIIGILHFKQVFASVSPKFHDRYTRVNEKRVDIDTICYPNYAIKDLTITQSAPIGVFEQTYSYSPRDNTIKQNYITLPEGAVSPATISITYKQGTNQTHPSNYDSLLYNEYGILLPESPQPDWSGDPVIFPNSFGQKTYTVRGESMSSAPDFSIAPKGVSPTYYTTFCEMSIDEFHECELELINQQYEKAESKCKVYDIQNFLLPKGFTNKDLPPELNRTLPKT